MISRDKWYTSLCAESCADVHPVLGITVTFFLGVGNADFLGISRIRRAPTGTVALPLAAHQLGNLFSFIELLTIFIHLPGQRYLCQSYTSRYHLAIRGDMLLPQSTLLAVLAVLASTPGGLAAVIPPALPLPYKVSESTVQKLREDGARDPELERFRAMHEKTNCATIIHGECQPAPRPLRPEIIKSRPEKERESDSKEGNLVRREDPNSDQLPPSPGKLPPGALPFWPEVYQDAESQEPQPWLSKSPPPPWLSKEPHVPSSVLESQAEKTSPENEDDSQSATPTWLNQLPRIPERYLYVENLEIGLDPNKEVRPPYYHPAGNLLGIPGLGFWADYTDRHTINFLACFNPDYDDPTGANRRICAKADENLKIILDNEGRAAAFAYKKGPDDIEDEIPNSQRSPAQVDSSRKPPYPRPVGWGWNGKPEPNWIYPNYGRGPKWQVIKPTESPEPTEVESPTETTEAELPIETNQGKHSRRI
ncbi:hypothetical protein V8F20_001432 [Naviculisporaceae sp. PSN 640]